MHEKPFGWIKTIAGGRKLRYLGQARKRAWFKITAAIYMLVGITAVGYARIDATDAEALPLKEQLTRFGMRQPRAGRWSTAGTRSPGCWRWRCGPSSATA